MIDIGVVHGRFQPLHLKHMEYILAAKMRCRKLIICIPGNRFMISGVRSAPPIRLLILSGTR